MSPVTPQLVCARAAEALEFYKKAFGAKEEARLPGPGGKIMHSVIRVGGAAIFVVDENPEWGALGPVSDQFWGDRYGQFEDPYGHHWSIGTHVRDVSEKEMAEAMKKMPKHPA